jgi:RNA polymerase sigma-B factor
VFSTSRPLRGCERCSTQDWPKAVISWFSTLTACACSTPARPACSSAWPTGPRRRGGALRAVGARGLSLEVLQIVSLDKRLGAYDGPADILAEFPVLATDPEVHAGRRQRPVAGQSQHHRARPALGGGNAAGVVPDRTELRRQAIEDNMAFAQRLARRFRDRGEPNDDLAQVAMVGLGQRDRRLRPAARLRVRRIRHADHRRRDPPLLPRQGLAHQGPAAACRNCGCRSTRPGSSSARPWAPRRPTPTWPATSSVSEEDVVEAIEVGRLYNPISLSAPAGPDTDLGIADPLGDEDPGMAAVENRESVKPLLASLP